jgi:hypothetical protein
MPRRFSVLFCLTISNCLCSIGLFSANGQEEEPAAPVTLTVREPATISVRENEPETLILALKSDSVSSAEDVMKSIELANKNAQKAPSPPFRFEKISGVRRIDQAIYDLVWNPFPASPATAADAVGDLKSNDAAVSVTSSPYTFLITTDHRAVAEEIEVSYVLRDSSDGAKKTAAFLKAGDQSAESQFRRLRAGTHEITLQPDWDPTSYRLRFSVINDQPVTAGKEWTEWQEWPGSKTKYFLAKLEGFSGRPEAIFEVLATVNSALKFERFEVRKRISYVAADLEAKEEFSPIVGGEFTDKGLEITLGVSSEIAADRVWALFPVDENGVLDAAKSLRTWPQSPYEKMKVFLGKSQVASNPYPIVLPPAGGSDLSGAVLPQPQWLSLMKAGTQGGTDVFRCEFKVLNKEELLERFNAAKKMVLVFERDPGDGDSFRGLITFTREENSTQEGFWDIRDFSVVPAQ